MPWMQKKWRLGHQCAVTPSEDVLVRMFPGSSCTTRAYRWVRRLCTVSPTNVLTAKYLRSEAYSKYEQLRHLSTFPLVIHPFSDFRKWWEIFMLIVFIVYFFVVPYTITFTKLIPDVHWFFAVSCMIDILINFLSGYINPTTKQIILHPGVISWKYIRSYFLFDLVSSIPFDSLGARWRVKMGALKYDFLFDLVALLKILRLKSVIEYLQRALESLGVEMYVRVLMRASLLVALIVHWVSCLLYYTAEFFQKGREDTIGYNDSWIIENKLVDRDPASRYLYSLFFGSSVMFRIDTGNAKVRTAEDIVAVTLVAIAAIVMYIWLVGEVLLLIRLTSVAGIKYEDMLQQLREYIHNKKLPIFLRNRLIKYYEYRFQRAYFHESDILDSLTGQLRQDIILHSCQRLVENVEFFNSLPLDLLISIVQCLRSEIYLPQDVIVKAGMEGESMYFLASGIVAVYSPSGQELAHLVDGAHFGEISILVEGATRVATVVAVEMCQVYRLHRDDFRLAVSPYPDLVERIEDTATERLAKTQFADQHNG